MLKICGFSRFLQDLRSDRLNIFIIIKTHFRQGSKIQPLVREAGKIPLEQEIIGDDKLKFRHSKDVHWPAGDVLMQNLGIFLAL